MMVLEFDFLVLVGLSTRFESGSRKPTETQDFHKNEDVTALQRV